MKTKRIAIIGYESYHARVFLKLIESRDEFSDIDVVGVYSETPCACQDLHGVRVMTSYDEAVGKTDGLIITARKGSTHYEYAKPYIESGIPMLIDKPFTESVEDAVALMRELKTGGARVASGSALRYDPLVKALKTQVCENTDGNTIGGVVRAPLMSDSPYGGFFFYAQHLVDIVCEIFGRYPKSVTAHSSDSQTTVTFHYEGFSCIGIYTERDKLFYAERIAQEKTCGGELAREGLDALLYEQLKEFHRLLNGEEQTRTYDDIIAPVFIMNAIKRSIETNTKQRIYYSIGGYQK